MRGYEKRRWIQTFSGRAFFPLSPQSGMIRIEDIAHALALKCRFTGHTREFYSVAQHSVLVSYEVSPAAAMWGLLHDAGEAYLPDVARPIKDLVIFKNPNRSAMFQFDEFEEIENRILCAVGEYAGLAWPPPAEIKNVDTRMLATERRDLMTPTALDWGAIADVEPFAETITPLDWREAEAGFLRRFEQIIEAQKCSRRRARSRPRF